MGDLGSDAEQRLRRVVNLGVLAVARVLGTPAEERLRIHCECGARGCRETVEASLAEHRHDDCATVIVCVSHRNAVRGRVVAVNDRFLKVTTATH